MIGDLSSYHVSDNARLLNSNLIGWYYAGQKIDAVLKVNNYECRMSLSLKSSAEIQVESGERFIISSDDDYMPVRFQPRAAKAHINLQKLEDNYHER